MSLHPDHRADLHRSGLTEDTINSMQVFSARPEDLNKLAGWDITARGVASALVFPYPECGDFYQLKVFPPFRNGDGHTVRYLQPRGSDPRAYILPSVRERLADPAESLLITEGAKKAARLAQEGYNAVGVGAVWNWKRGGENVAFTDPAALIPDLRAVVVLGRRVFLCFDSDVWRRDRGDCRLGLYALGRHLERVGASVRVVRLPAPTKEEQANGIGKVGVDDYLERHSAEDFRRLLLAAIPLTHKTLTEAARQWAKKEEATRPFVEPISRLLSKPETSVDWLIDSLLARGDAGFIAAEPKVAKSWLLYLMAVCLASGQSFLGFKVPRQRRILLMSEEDSRQRLRRRVRQLIAGLGGPVPEDAWLRFTARSGFKLDAQTWLERLREELATFRPDVVLLDVLRRLHDLDENSNQDMGKITNTLNDLRRDFGCGFFIAHHNRKLSQGATKRGRGGQEMSGAGVLHGWSEASLYLTKGSGKGKVVVVPEHKDAPEMEPFLVRLEDAQTEDGRKAVRILNEGPATVDKGAQTRQRILESLSLATGQTVKELSEALGLHMNTLRAHLKALEADGAVLHRKADVGQAVQWFLST